MKKVNERYGNWTVLYLADHAPYGSRMCICRCDCGRLYKRSYSSIKNGGSNQCKQCRDVAFSNKRHRHGLSDSRVYRIWAKIKQRCTNPKTKKFYNYGGRGIKVCAEWENDFIPFYNWAITHGYNDNLSIDRIDPNGDYCPENCRWADWHTQSANTRKNNRNTSGYKGISYDKRRKKYRAYIGVHKKRYELGEYATLEQAVKARQDFIKNNNLTEYNG